MSKHLITLLCISTTLVFSACTTSGLEKDVSQKSIDQERGSGVFEEKNNTVTYSNEKFGHTYKFPKNSVTIYNSEDLKNESSLAQEQSNLFLGENANISISVYLNGQSEMYQEENILKYDRFKKTRLGSHDVYKSESVGSGEFLFMTTVIFGKKYIYEISYSNEAKNQKYENILNALLETFRWESA